MPLRPTAAAPTPIAPNVWIFDAPPIRTLGVALPLRMTIVRLSGGDLILHSPTQFSADLKASIEALGRIRHLVAPSVAHWMFLRAWQDACPGAVTWAVPGLAGRWVAKRSGLRIDEELSDEPPREWGGEVETVLVRGLWFREVDLFHKPSRTLILTDLVLNLEPAKLPRPLRPAARMMGVTDGRAPPYLRALLTANAAVTAPAAARLVTFEPERVVFAHGAWFRRDAATRLRRSLAWLTRAAPAEDFKGQVVVIAGASSGVGRAAALTFAARGADVVLAARRAAPLETLAEACRDLGVRAIANPVDVADPNAVRQLAKRADDSFGRIDVWINNAGAGVFGPYQDVDMALHRRTVEVNLLGAMNGAHAVLPVFLRQGRGTLINTVSMGGLAPTPFTAAYTASKFGLRGFAASLRQELADHPHIHVCAVFPSMVDTPAFAHAANLSGRDLDPGPLLYAPQDVAETFVALAREPRDEVAVGWPARVAGLSWTVARGPVERFVASAMRARLTRAERAPRTDGGLLEPQGEGIEATGGWLSRKGLPPARLINRGFAIGAAVVLGGAIALTARRWRRD